MKTHLELEICAEYHVFRHETMPKTVTPLQRVQS